MQLGLCSTRRGDPMSSRYCTSALAAGPAADHIQVGSSDVHGLQHVHSGLPERPNHGTRTLRSSAIPLLVQPFPGQTYPGLVLSNFQHRLSETRCHKQF